MKQWASLLRRSLLEGRLQKEQQMLDEEFVPHQSLLASGLCKSGAKNDHLNRYSNLFPLDSHRVVLRGGLRSFVNASSVVMPGLPPRESERGFIVAQGPMHPLWHGPDTLGDFWRLVFEQNVSCVVTMSKESAGFTGFAPWWPTGGEGSKATFGEFKVSVLREESTAQDNIRRELRVQCGESGGEERCVLQLQTLAWPNYGVPSNTSGIQELLSMCREARATSSPGQKTVVHCSGGVGRSGTFLSVYCALASIEWTKEDGQSILSPEVFSLLPFVRALRNQRHSMCVEGIEQLGFAYECFAAELTERDFGGDSHST